MVGQQPAGCAEESAPAKINLALHVTGRRADGYHLLDSLVAFAGIGDRVRLTPQRTGFSVIGPFAAAVPLDDANLCLRAARLAGCQTGVEDRRAPGGVAIALHKALPVAAGIGGGSSDAAAVLRGLARLGQPLPSGNAGRLGADVPVCLTAPAPARMRGIGETVTPLPPLPAVPMVLCNPAVPLSTPAIFAALAQRENPPLPDDLPRFTDAAGLGHWLARQRNDLQPAAIAAAPVIAEVLAALGATGASLARMSGSGATCFGLYATPSAAAAAAASLSRRGWWAVATAIA